MRPGRPGELLEPVPVVTGGGRLVEIAGRIRLDIDLAAAVAAERSLLRDDLMDPFNEAAELLDVHSAEATVIAPIGAAEAAYLRSLRKHATLGQRFDECLSVRIPARLRRRLADLRFDSLSEGDVRQAVAWERAAVLEGRTMSEWAWRTLWLAIRGRAD